MNDPARPAFSAPSARRRRPTAARADTGPQAAASADAPALVAEPVARPRQPRPWSAEAFVAGPAVAAAPARDGAWWRFTAGALVGVVAATAVMAGLLLPYAARLRADVDARQAALAALAAGGPAWRAAGTDLAPGAALLLVEAIDDDRTYALITGLVPPPEGYLATLWFVEAGTLAPVATVAIDASGSGLAVLGGRVGSAEAVMVTYEPGGRGDPFEPGPDLIRGRLR